MLPPLAQLAAQAADVAADLVSPTWWLINAVVALAGLWVTSATVTVEWPKLSTGWRWTKAGVVTYFLVMTYSTVEAYLAGSPAGPRVFGVLIVSAVFLVAGVIVADEEEAGLVPSWVRPGRGRRG